MCDLIRPGFQRIGTVHVETRQHTPIPNGQSFEVTRWLQSIDADNRAKHRTAGFRTDIIPVYNCHGLTFASRRTGIDLSESVRTIIKEDGYEKVDLKNVLPGDVILYLSPDNDGDVEHSGVVVRVEKFGDVNVPFVCSKWGRGSEVLHHWTDCEYDSTHVEYYRVVR
jgi:hypothetical protein